MGPLALIFDVDGTLADTEEIHRSAFNQTFAEVGLDWFWDRELYKMLLAVTGGKERMAHYMDISGRPSEISSEVVSRIHEKKTRLYGELMTSGEITLRPGVERLLKEALEHRVALGIATTTSKENVTALLDATLGYGSEKWFRAIAAGDMVESKKPASDIYRLALEMLELEPNSTVAFEDSENGLLSASGAGIPTVITVNYFTADQSFPGAITVLDHLGDPEFPSKVIQGRPLRTGLVDLDWLEEWFGYGG